MSWKLEKIRRIRNYYENSFGFKKQICYACNGSGYYDHNDSPNCDGCNGTGYDYAQQLNEYSHKIISKLLKACKAEDYEKVRIYSNMIQTYTLGLKSIYKGDALKGTTPENLYVHLVLLYGFMIADLDQKRRKKNEV